MDPIYVDDVRLDEMAQQIIHELGKRQTLDSDVSKIREKLGKPPLTKVRHRISNLSDAGCIKVYPPETNNSAREIELTRRGQSVLNDIEEPEPNLDTTEERLSAIEDRVNELEQELEQVWEAYEEQNEFLTRLNSQMPSAHRLRQEIESFKQEKTDEPESPFSEREIQSLKELYRTFSD